MNAGDAAKLTAWLIRHSEHISFGEVSIKLILHDGQIKRVEKTIVEKDQP